MQDAIWDCVIGFLGTCGGMDGSRRCLPGPFLALERTAWFPYATRTKNDALESILRRFARMTGPNVPEEHKRA